MNLSKPVARAAGFFWLENEEKSEILRMSKKESDTSTLRSAGARRAVRFARWAGAVALLTILRISFSSAAAAFPASAMPAARPMSLDDLLTAVRVADPQVSPDGRHLAYVRTTTDLAAGKRDADVWIVPVDGSAPPRPLTRNEKTDEAPRFSPDGKTLAFISNRGGAPQAYVLDLSGGEPRKLTDLSAGVKAPLVFSPDGKKLAFVSDVFPDCADEACNRNRREAAEKSPVKVHHLTRLMYRHWDEWREDVRHHVLVADVATGAVTDVTPGDFDSPPHHYEEDAIAFSPGGSEIAFVSNRDGNDREAFTTNKDVFVVPVAGGVAEKLTVANAAADFSPAFTPDGTSILVRAQRRPTFEADRWYLDLYDRKTKTKRTLFETPDLSVSEFCLSRDGKTVYFTAETEGRKDLFEVSLSGGTPRLLKKGGAIGSLRVSRGFLVFTESTLTAPAEIFSLPLEEKSSSPATRSRQARALTDENRSWRKDVAFSQPESLSTAGAAGARIQYWLIKPPAFDPAKKYPVVFLIHGGPQNAWEDGWSFRWCESLWAAQGWVVVAPNPRGSTGFGQKFVDEISGDWGGKVMVDLDVVFDAVVKMPFVDATRQGIAGASYGGYAVDWILGHTGRFKAAVTHDGVFNLESMTTVTEELWFMDWDFGGPPWTAVAKEQFAKWSPHLFADRITTPTLVITNEKDFRVPVDQGLQHFTVLRRKGVPSEALVFPDEGHFVLKPLNSKRWHEAVFGWMKRYLEP
jgi:dipeptidyl aminopeptidase/acylaminoacyl peptidase